MLLQLSFDFHANGNQKKAGVAILISNKIDFKIKTITRDKEGNYIMIKGSIQEEDITIVNIYACNRGAPQYIRQMLTAIKGEIDSNTVTVGEFNPPLTSMDRTSRQEKEIKGIQNGREEVKLPLFEDDMILHIEKPKVSTRKTIRTNE